MNQGRLSLKLLFEYYNTEHRHSGIGLMTPEAVHYGHAAIIQAQRQRTLLQAYAEHPERFVKKLPEPPELPTAAWINPPRDKTTREDGSESTIVTPADTWAPLKTTSGMSLKIMTKIITARDARSTRDVLQ